MLLRAWRYCFVISLLTCWLPCSGNQDHALLQFGDRLYASGHYDAAITEFLRFQFFYPQSAEVFYADYKIGLCHDALGHFATAGSWLRQSLRRSEATWRPIIRYRLALSLYSAGQIDAARIELFKLLNGEAPDSVRAAAGTIFAAVSTRSGDWQLAEQTLAAMAASNDDNGLYPRAQRRLQHLRTQPEPYSPEAAKWLSTMVPGSGQMYAGEFFNGLNALAINAGVSYLLYREIREEDISDAVLLFALLWWRFYNGNRYQAEQAAIRANRAYQLQEVQTIDQILRQGLQEQGSARLEISLRQIVQE